MEEYLKQDKRGRIWLTRRLTCLKHHSLGAYCRWRVLELLKRDGDLQACSGFNGLGVACLLSFL